MKRKLSKSLSIILTITIVISVIIFAPVTVNAANTADSIVDIARAEIGNSYYQKYNGHKNAWCADFVTWCAKQAGVSSIASSSSCYNMYEGMRGSCERVYSPQKGDIVFFYCNKCSTTAGKWCHVGIMEDSTHSIEGNNWSDGTSKVQRGKSYNHNGDLGYRHGDSSGCITRIYLRPNYGNSPTTPPKNPVVSFDKKAYKIGESVTFSFSSELATEQYIPVDFNGKRKYFLDATNQNSLTFTPDNVGIYGVFLYVKNSVGEASSEYLQFEVYNGKPEDLSITTNKCKFNVGESVTFNISEKYSEHVYIPIDYNGKRDEFIEVTGNTNYKYNLTKAGTYGFFLVCRNQLGETISDYYTFEVEQSKPKDLSIKTNKLEYNVGETIVFDFSATYASELYLPIDYNGKRQDFYDVTGRSEFSLKAENVGVYGFFLYAKNEFGESSSEYYEFRVEQSKPKNLSIKTNKLEYNIGETVVFDFSATYANELYLPMDYEGKRQDFYDVTGKSQFLMKAEKAGIYGFFLYCKNEYGETSSQYYQISVVPPDLDDSFIALVSNTYSGVMLENRNDNIVVGNEKHIKSQLWKFVKNTDNTYTIMSLDNNKVIDVYQAEISNGTNIWAYDSNGTDAQKWYITKNRGGYTFVSKIAPYSVLDLAYNKAEDGANIQLHSENSSYAQIFSIYPISNTEIYLKNLKPFDVDLDNSVTVADATLLQKYVVGIATLTDDQKLLADCNGDGSIDVRDATYILKTIVKIPV